jgi:parvulin-like peptidyl-prolyl isomerase
VRVGLVLLAAAGIACGAPGDPPPSGAPGAPEVVARVEGQAVTREELAALASQLASRRPGRAEPTLDDALDAWIEAHVLQAELSERGLDQSEGYRQRRAAIRARAWRSEQELARKAVVGALEDGLVVSEEELRALYDENAQRYVTTRLHLRQITVPDRATILGIRKQLADGASFEALARQANLDPALRKAGGDLGWLEQRKLPTSLIGPAHKLVEPGAVTEPFEDREGRWNLVQLVARDEAARRSFESVREQLEHELRVLRSRELLAERLAERRQALRVERVAGD